MQTKMDTRQEVRGQTSRAHARIWKQRPRYEFETEPHTFRIKQRIPTDKSCGTLRDRKISAAGLQHGCSQGTEAALFWTSPKTLKPGKQLSRLCEDLRHYPTRYQEKNNQLHLPDNADSIRADATGEGTWKRT